MDLAERLSGIRVQVRAPGADIRAELRRKTEIALTFGESVYEFVDEAALERILADLARLLWAGWQRAYRAAIEETNLLIEADDVRDSNFFRDRAKVSAIGESGSGRVAISSVGMTSYTVRLAPGTVRVISAEQLGREVSEAAAALIEDFQAAVNELKKRYYE